MKPKTGLRRPPAAVDQHEVFADSAGTAEEFSHRITFCRFLFWIECIHPLSLEDSAPSERQNVHSSTLVACVEMPVFGFRNNEVFCCGGANTRAEFLRSAGPGPRRPVPSLKGDRP